MTSPSHIVVHIIFEVAAVLAAAFALWVVLGRGQRNRGLAVLTGLVAAAVLLAEIPGSVRSSTARLVSVSLLDNTRPDRDGCLLDPPSFDRRALERTARRIPLHDRYVFEFARPPRTDWPVQCAEFILLPRRPVSSRAQAQWVIRGGLHWRTPRLIHIRRN